ncbi:MAG: response regulator transcription factor [Bryobacterales bacterium]|nr:response regulator transcription factor [Bryobacterales bacterium]
MKPASGALPDAGRSKAIAGPRAGDWTGDRKSTLRLLVVEDEHHIAVGLRFNLQAEGYAVTLAEDGESALRICEDATESFDLIVLDVMLPGISGFAVVEGLRATGNYVPVLMLTARGRPEDVVNGFAAGADDYLPKPFELAVLLARIQALLRRTYWARNAAKPPEPVPLNGLPVCFELGDKVILFDDLKILDGDQQVPLTLMESNLLKYLIEREGRAVSRKSLLEDVWGLHEDTDTRAIDNFIVRLRRYLEDDPQNPRHLLTVRGVGYRFESAKGE